MEAPVKLDSAGESIPIPITSSPPFHGPTPTTSSEEQVSKLNAGARAAVAISAIVGVLIVAGIGVFLFRRRNRWRAQAISKQRMQELHVKKLPMRRTLVERPRGKGSIGPRENVPDAQSDDMRIGLVGGNVRGWEYSRHPVADQFMRR